VKKKLIDGPLDQIVAQQMQTATVEKSVLDKLFAKEDIQKITEIHKKTNPTREDMQELLQLLNGMEQKLLNYDEDYPHILGRYFVRIRETFALYEAIEEFYANMKHLLKEKRTIELYESMIYKLKSTCLIYSSNYQQIGRSTMSIEGVGFFNALTNKFELSYPNLNQPPNTEKGLLGRVFN